MTFDVSTLTFAGGVVAFASGLILLMNWWLDRTSWSAFWWGAAGCGTGVGVAMLALHDTLPGYLSNIVGPLILNGSAASTLVAARIFNRGSVKPIPALAAQGAWIAIQMLTGAYAYQQFAVALGAGISGCLFAAAGFEFWLGRREALRGRWPMIFVLSLEAIALFLAAVGFASPTRSEPTPPIGWFGMIHFVGLIYAGGSAIFLIMMLKGRSEAKHKAAALVDSLTGLANRRAFMDRAQRLFDRGGRDDSPISLLAFDLDLFKEINDAYGHPTGDRVLQIFADVLSAALRPADIAGRLGGEEFAAALPGCDAPAALAVARRIRDAFQGDARFLNGQRLDATVSVGVATAAESGRSLAGAIASADSALYRAKVMGRNRVILAENGARARNSASVVRIA
jgi:diguanylate cyclase (GGDEF)-like protein